MKDRETINELLDYFQSKSETELQFDQEAIVASYQESDDGQSLAIKILSVFGGLLASVAFVGFLLIVGLHDSDFGLSLFGAIFIGGAIWINKMYDKIIIDTLSVSFFIIGFILLGIGMDKMGITGSAISVVFILIAFFSLYVVQNYIISFVSVLGINASILILIKLSGGYGLAHIYISSLALVITYCFLSEAKLIYVSKEMSKLYSPVRIGLIFSFLSGLGILVRNEILPVPPDFIWLSSVIIILAIIYALSNLLEMLSITKVQHRVGIYLSSILLLLPTGLSPGISGAILVILLSFLVNFKTGLIIGIVAFLYFISQYYYDLNFTLLTKSILLFTSGVLFVVLYFLSNKMLLPDEKS